MKEKPTYSIPYSPFRPACGPRGEFLAICGLSLGHSRGFTAYNYYGLNWSATMYSALTPYWGPWPPRNKV
jgi:hypothetical protein